MNGKILKLDIGGIPEGGELYAPTDKNENGGIVIHTDQAEPYDPIKGLADLPDDKYWTKIPPNFD